MKLVNQNWPSFSLNLLAYGTSVSSYAPLFYMDLHLICVGWLKCIFRSTSGILFSPDIVVPRYCENLCYSNFLPVSSKNLYNSNFAGWENIYNSKFANFCNLYVWKGKSTNSRSYETTSNCRGCRLSAAEEEACEIDEKNKILHSNFRQQNLHNLNLDNLKTSLIRISKLGGLVGALTWFSTLHFYSCSCEPSQHHTRHLHILIDIIFRQWLKYSRTSPIQISVIRKPL